MEKALILSGEEKPVNAKLNPSMLLLMTDSFQEIISYLPKAYGSAGLSMIYSMGHENGTYEVKRLRKDLQTLNISLPKNELMEKAFERASSMGWGKIALEKNNEVMGKVNVFVRSNPFSGNCEEHGTPGCIFIRGFIAGIIAEASEIKTRYDNPECMDVDFDCCLLRVKEAKET